MKYFTLMKKQTDIFYHVLNGHRYVIGEYLNEPFFSIAKTKSILDFYLTTVSYGNYQLYLGTDGTMFGLTLFRFKTHNFLTIYAYISYCF